MIGKLIEFKVTPELLSVLANFLEHTAQLEPVKIEDTQTPEMLSRFLTRRRAAVRERVNTLLYLLQTARVDVVDSEVVDAVDMLRLSHGARALIDAEGALAK